MTSKKVRYWVSLFVALTFLMGLTSPAVVTGTETAVGLTDISDHWAKDKITQWVEKGLVSGYNDGTFKPDKSITRAEFMTLVNKAFNFGEKASIDFSDVMAGDWFYAEVAKAVKAGYISGYQDGTVKPNREISRQEAAVALCKALNLEAKDTDEIQKFTDKDSIPLWSRPYICALAAEGYMGGYPDGSFKAERHITRAETVTMLDKALGALKVSYDVAGIYGPEEGIETVPQDVAINVPGVTLRNMIIEGDLYLNEGIGEGDVTLENVTVKGTTTIRGGGKDSIHLVNFTGQEIIVIKVGGRVRIVASGDTTVEELILESGAHIEGNGIASVTVLKPGEDVILDGDFENVSIEADVNVEVLEGTTINNLQVNSRADVNLANGATVKDLTLEAPAAITGQGTIQAATINADGAKLEPKPKEYKLAEGVTAEIAGKEVKEEEKKSSGGGSGPSEVKVTGISVSPKTMTLKVGETGTITGTITPSDATNKKVTWTSSNANVATVANGVVTAKAAGTATITATSAADSSKKASCTVTVEKEVKPEVNKAELKTAIATAQDKIKDAKVGGEVGNYPEGAVDALNEAIAIAQAVVDKADVTQEEVDVAVTALNQAVATFEAAVVTAPGTYIVTLSSNPTYGGTVTVTNAVYTVSDAVYFKAGDEVIVTATPNQGYKFIAWTGYKESKENPYMFEMPANNVSLTANFEIITSVSAISVDPDVMLLTVDQTETIVATVQPSNASNKRVTWSSSDTAVATVDASGKVTAVAGGTATITVTSVADSSKKATKQVLVGDKLVPAEGSIQEVINGAADNDVIVVAPGIYEEQLTIGKPLTLLGPNAGIAGIGTRNSEAVITYPDAPQNNPGSSGEYAGLLLIKADDVVITGFTFDDGGKSVDSRLTRGINAHGNNIKITNNIVDGFNYIQILVTSSFKDNGGWDRYSEYCNEVLIEGNHCQNALGFSAIYLQGAAGTVKKNTVENACRAIQIQPYGESNGGTVEDNNLNGFMTGIYYNYANKGAGEWLIEDNTITAAQVPDDYNSIEKWAGIEIQTFGTEGNGAAPKVTFENNGIDGEGSALETVGILMTPNIANDATATFTGNTFSNVDIGARKNAGSLDLGEVLEDNIFPDGYIVIGNEIIKNDKTVIATAEAFKAFLENPDQLQGILTADISFDENIYISANKELDLNGYTVEQTKNATRIYVGQTNSAKLNVTNSGSEGGFVTDYDLFRVEENSELEINDCSIKRASSDSAANPKQFIQTYGSNIEVKISGCTFVDGVLYIGKADDENVQVIIQSSDMSLSALVNPTGLPIIRFCPSVNSILTIDDSEISAFSAQNGAVTIKMENTANVDDGTQTVVNLTNATIAFQGDAAIAWAIQGSNYPTTYNITDCTIWAKKSDNSYYQQLPFDSISENALNYSGTNHINDEVVMGTDQIATAEEFKDFLEDPAQLQGILTADISFDENIYISANKELDLNGYTVEQTKNATRIYVGQTNSAKLNVTNSGSEGGFVTDYDLFRVEENSELEINDCSIKRASSDSAANPKQFIQTYGSNIEVKISECTFEDGVLDIGKADDENVQVTIQSSNMSLSALVNPTGLPIIRFCPSVNSILTIDDSEISAFSAQNGAVTIKMENTANVDDGTQTVVNLTNATIAFQGDAAIAWAIQGSNYPTTYNITDCTIWAKKSDNSYYQQLPFDSISENALNYSGTNHINDEELPKMDPDQIATPEAFKAFLEGDPRAAEDDTLTDDVSFDEDINIIEDEDEDTGTPVEDVGEIKAGETEQEIEDEEVETNVEEKVEESEQEE